MPLSRVVCRPCLALMLLVAASAAAQAQGGSAEGHLTSSNSGPNAFNGLNINNLVGANRFYSAGYTGTRATAAVIEAGSVWNGHETLGHVSTYLDARDLYAAQNTSSGSLGQFDRHATWVGQALGGRPSVAGGEIYQRGIAYGADLWSGAIATSYNGTPYTLGFSFSRGYAFTEPYNDALINGVNGKRADVVNSSFGFTDPDGSSVFTLAADGIARQSRKTIVFSAGNSGSGANTVGGPASGYNGISVGATGSDTSQTPYSTVSSFSSRGPQDYRGPTGPVVPGVRPRVDIVAPGQNLTLAFYGGTTGGNQGGTDSSNGATNFYSSNLAGTSFAAPIVSGGATLLCDVAYDRFGSNVANATDGEVIKAVLMNSADKLPGWNNGQTTVNGIVGTEQALDYAQGAGALNLNQAFDQYTTGTTDLAGLGGGTVATIGWDFGTVGEGLANDYLFSSSLLGGSRLDATLNWFVNRQFVGTDASGFISASDLAFTNLGLQVYRVESGVNTLVAFSSADYSSTQLLSFLLPQTGVYLMRVVWEGERYDTTGLNNAQTYGLAWNVQSSVITPEPSTVGLFLVGLIVPVGVQRRRAVRTIRSSSGTVTADAEAVV